MKLISLIRQRGPVCLWYKFKNTYLKPDKDIREIGARNGSYEYLKRFAKECNSSVANMQPGEKIIWVCWLQGMENAPALVQKCAASIRQYCGEYRVIELTEENIPKYISLPAYIWDKYHAGIISRTHFSDILRFALLAENGGIWIDATTLLTGPFPAYVVDTPLFVYHSDQKGSSLLSMNFISCHKHHPLIEDTINQLYAYWKRSNYMVDYNIAAVFWTSATRANAQNATLWRKVLFVPTGLKEILIHELNEPYSEERWQQICALSTVHKLTYKFDEFGINTTLDGSFYNYIFR